MQVGILTRRDGYNLGSSLQAYALYTILDKLGANPVMINYFEYSTKARIKFFALKLAGRLFKFSQYLRASYKQRKNFDSFNKEYRLSNKAFHYAIPIGWNESFDKVVCGSDQIWNPNQTNSTFMLEFVPDDVERIAYAPSLGQSDCKSKFTVDEIRLLTKFKFLSCRENNGSKVIEKLTQRTCSTVVDPTMLLSVQDWMKKEVRVDISGKYLLTYFLGPSKNYPTEFVEKIATERDLKIINICLPHYKGGQLGENMYVGPRQFLYLIHHADIILTNSFHGCVFSLIFNKLFYILSRGYTISDYNESSRFETLLESTGINLINSDIFNGNLPYESIDYQTINAIIKERIQKSIKYLNTALYE